MVRIKAMAADIQPHNPALPRALTAPEFARLADVPPEAQWFANLTSNQTRRAYQNDLAGFMRFTGIVKPEEFRLVTRSHVLAWRADLERQLLSGATIRRKLAALASLYDYLCECNAVLHNPVKGVKRPVVDTLEGKTPALGDAQARALLNAPPADTLKGKRDRAILAVLLFHALRRKNSPSCASRISARSAGGFPICACRARAANCASFPRTPARCAWWPSI